MNGPSVEVCAIRAKYFLRVKVLKFLIIKGQTIQIIMTKFEFMRGYQKNFWRREAFRGILLLVIIVAVWCIFWGRTSLKAWNVPIIYRGDSILVMAWAKAVADGNYAPILSKINPSLGAPFAANWNDYPVTEDALIYCIGVAARITGLFAACNLGVLIAHLLAGITFYGACRWLRYSWEWALTGALLFVFSTSSVRSLSHITILYYWHIPLCLLICWWFGSRRGLGFEGGRYWFALAVGFLTGIQNPYYTNIFLQFLGFSALVQLIRRNTWQTIAAPASVGVVTLLAFAVMNADSISYGYLHGKNPAAVSRNYAALEIYSMKPMELFIPPDTHRVSFFKELGYKYEHEAYVKGEITSRYLGLVGIGALLWLSISTAMRLLQRPQRPVPVCAMQIGWIGLYSVIGGLNCILGIFGFLLFRAGNRYSIFILALVLFFLVGQLTKTGCRLRPYLKIVLALSICIFGLWDQLPKRITKKEVDGIASVINADAHYTRALESSLPDCAMIFQLPVADFPEFGSVNGMGDYEHLRPYLFSHHLRYSYGNDKGRIFDIWQQTIARMPPAEMIAALESFGFSAIYINRKGYVDKADSLIDGLKKAGRDQVLQNSLGDMSCILLHPAKITVLPILGPAFSSGFYNVERDGQEATWRWSRGDADIEIINPSNLPCAMNLVFEISSPESRQVDLFLESKKVCHVVLAKSAQQFENVNVSLNPGINKLHFVTDRPASRIAHSPDARKFGFMLRNFSINYATPDHPE